MTADASRVGLLLAFFDDDVADAIRRRVIPFRHEADPAIERWLTRWTDAATVPRAEPTAR